MKIVLFIMTLLLGLSSTTYSQVVPNGAYTKTYVADYIAIPSGFNAGIFWLAAATIENTPNQNAKIYISSMKVIEKNIRTGKESEIESFDYGNDESFTENNGGLYDRSPKWFGNSDHHVPMGSSVKITNGNLILDVGKNNDNIYHWWSSRFETTTDYNYILEVTYKIDGSTALCVGFDHWRDLDSDWNGLNVNNKQAFVSEWHGDTGGKFETLREALIR